MRAKIFDIQRNSFVDGPGIRTTVFLKGCNLNCKWCHNPESQLPKTQLLFYQSKCVSCGRCKEVCPHALKTCEWCGRCAVQCPTGAREVCGKEYTVEEVFCEVAKDRIFYQTSGGGVTFSGGECMLQIEFLREILKKCKEQGIHTAVDTAGDVPWEYFEKIMSVTDLFLYDIKCFSDNLHREGTGNSNELILQNLQKLSEQFSGDVIIRVPVIGGFNDREEELKQIATFVKKLRYKKTELLPYHEMGNYKYEALGRQYTSYYVPRQEEMEKYRTFF